MNMEARITVDKISEIGRKIQFQIPNSEYSNHYTQQLNRTRTKVSIKGFRPGKAP
ncbi:trigger factor family protein, partial [bacterium]|nr:trigger factor family protein [bacterium]